MKTNELAKSTFVDDGECVSFHRFSSALDTSSFIYSGYELLVLPEGAYRLTVAGEAFSLQGPRVILLGPGLEHGWSYVDSPRLAAGPVLPGGAGLAADSGLPGADGLAGVAGDLPGDDGFADGDAGLPGGGSVRAADGLAAAEGFAGDADLLGATGLRADDGPAAAEGLADGADRLPAGLRAAEGLAGGADRPGGVDGRRFDGQSDGGLAVHWPADLLGDGFLEKRQTQAIAALLEKAAFGVRFDAAVIPDVLNRLDLLRERTGFVIYLELLALLHELSVADFRPLLACLPVSVPDSRQAEKKSPIDEAMALMKANYFRPMTLEEMARKACMTKGSFCRRFRAKTGKTYSESLNEIRLGHICRLLAETTDTVSEIAYRAGYQNIHHFHRHFKRVKGCTPLEFREGRR